MTQMVDTSLASVIGSAMLGQPLGMGRHGVPFKLASPVPVRSKFLERRSALPMRAHSASQLIRISMLEFMRQAASAVLAVR